MSSVDIVDLLKSIEWLESTNGFMCPDCRKEHREGEEAIHESDCQLKQALDAGTQLQAAPTTDLLEKQEVMRKLAKDKSVSVRTVLASNKHLPLDVMEDLSKDSSSAVHCAIAGNESVPNEILLEMVKGVKPLSKKGKRLARHLKDNYSASSDLVDFVSKSLENYYQHDVLVKHPHISEATLIAIQDMYQSDPYNSYVSRNATKRLKELQTGKNSPSELEIAKSGSTSQRQELAMREDLPLEVIELLANDKSQHVRSSLVESLKPTFKASSARSQQESATEAAEPEVKTLLTSTDIWCEMATDKKASARYMAAYNVPIERMDLLEKLAGDDEDSDVPYALAKRPDMPLAILELCAKCSNTTVKTTVIEHANCSSELLQQLAKDSDYEVRVAVARRLKKLESPSKDKPEAAKSEEPSKEPAKSNLAPFLMGAAGFAGMMLNAVSQSTPSVRVAETTTEAIETAMEVPLEARA